MTPRTKVCTPATRRGRLDRAKQFAATAADIETDDHRIDAYVTNCIHAGIAAADVICCARLGEHARGENHQQAVALLAKVDDALAKDLRTLLGMKTSSGCSDVPASRDHRRKAGRAMDRRLLEVAQAAA